MTPVSQFKLRIRQLLLLLVPAAVAFFLSLGITSLHAADSTLAVPLCDVLKQLLPEVKTFKPEGARAQLVMAIAERFEYDANTLRQVKTEIDRATTSSCPKDREAFLGILKLKSLAEAVN